MINKRGFNAESNQNKLTGKITTFFKSLNSLKVYAEEAEGTTTPPADNNTSTTNTNTTTPTVNYEDLIAKARKEEKDKLYPKITNLESEVEKWTKKCNEHLIALGNKDTIIEDLNTKLNSTGKSDSEIEKKYKAEVEGLKSDIEKLKASKVDESAIEERVKGEYEVKLYRETKLRELGEGVIPELVTGLTKEDIDASSKVAKQRYDDLTTKILGSATANIPPANTSTSRADINSFKVEDLSKMDAGSPEYRELRTKLGFK